MKLSHYRQKRNFNKTPEPKGKIKKSSHFLYVIQKHAASHLHYDFRLELNGVLLSWAVPKGPCLDPQVKRLAMHVEDHPIEYGSFEGIIPKGEYGGGTVMLWDKGEWIPQEDNPSKAYARGTLKFILKGEKLKGLWSLIRINNNDKTWLLIKLKDDYSKSLKKYDVTIEEPYSVSKLSSFPFDSKPSKIPEKFFPQLATLVNVPPLGKQWLHEIKFDGYRIIAIKKNGKTRLLSRNDKNWTEKFKKIAKAIDAFPIKNVIFDGEIVVLDEDNKSNFQLLQNYKEENSDQLHYYIFDLIYYDKFDLTTLTLLERKNFLKDILVFFTNDSILYSDHVVGSGKTVFKKACDLGLEGIISKDSKSQYIENKRTKTWLKSKCIKRQEFVIGGYTKPQGARGYFGALLIGTYNKQGELIYNGHVGTGFTNESLKSIYTLLKKNISQENPFTTKPPLIKRITWVKPTLVAEIEFTEWTKEESLRHPSFKGLKLDKKHQKVIKEIPTSIENISHFKLTNPDKLIYPEDHISKADLASYYETIQKWILPFISKRPLMILRCPDGYKNCFHQKHIPHASKALHKISIKEKNKKSDYVYINDVAGLQALSQLGVLEIHPWGSRIKDIERPDMIIFDLDPSPGISWKKIVEAANDVKKHLSQLKLKSFVKTTGGKGLHVVVPIKPEYTWAEIKNFSHTFVDFLVQSKPNDYIGTISKEKRKGKIFIDYLRNQRGATAVAPYSTRAQIHAPVSTPLAWNELTNQFEDTYFTLKTLPERLNKLKKDPWKEFHTIKQSLKSIR